MSLELAAALVSTLATLLLFYWIFVKKQNIFASAKYISVIMTLELFSALLSHFSGNPLTAKNSIMAAILFGVFWIIFQKPSEKKDDS